MEKEKLYTTMKNSGILNIVLGSVVIAVGAVSGGLILASGITLLVRKNDLTF